MAGKEGEKSKILVEYEDTSVEKDVSAHSVD